MSMEEWKSDPYVLLFFSFWIMWTCYCVFNIILFFIHRSSSSIANRCPWLIFLSALGQYAMLTSQTWKIIIRPEHFPNIVDHWFLWIMMPLHFVSYPIRAVRIHIKYNLAITDISNDTLKALQEKQQKRKQEKHQTQPEESEKSAELSGSLIADDEQPLTPKHSTSQPDLPHSSNKFLDFIRKHPKLQTDKAFVLYALLVMLVPFCLGLVRQFTEPENGIHERGYGTTRTSFISMIVLLTVAEIFLWWTVWKLKDIHDDLQVNTELIAIGSLWLVFLIPFIATGWISLYTNYIPRRVPPIFNILLCYFSFLLSFGMPVHLACITPEKPRSIDIFKSIDNVLENEEATQLILEHSFALLCPEIILFLIDMKDYLETTDPDELQIKHDKIIKKYIENDAQYHVNVDGRYITEVLNSTSRASSTSFQKVYNDARRVAQNEIIPKFLQTPEAAAFSVRYMAKYAPMYNPTNDDKQ